MTRLPTHAPTAPSLVALLLATAAVACGGRTTEPDATPGEADAGPEGDAGAFVELTRTCDATCGPNNMTIEPKSATDFDCFSDLEYRLYIVNWGSAERESVHVELFGGDYLAFWGDQIAGELLQAVDTEPGMPRCWGQYLEFLISAETVQAFLGQSIYVVVDRPGIDQDCTEGDNSLELYQVHCP
jgi:hypothetical protein